jgi:hypothetical protein
MLAILFIGTRMRALQITEQKGQPQGYAQQAMFLTTWAINFQIALVTVFGLLTHIPLDNSEANAKLLNSGDTRNGGAGAGSGGRNANNIAGKAGMTLGSGRDANGNVVAMPAQRGAVAQVIASVCEVFRYTNLVAMYAGAIIVIYSIYDVNLKNADGSGLLFPGYRIPAPL